MEWEQIINIIIAIVINVILIKLYRAGVISKQLLNDLGVEIEKTQT